MPKTLPERNRHPSPGLAIFWRCALGLWLLIGAAAFLESRYLDPGALDGLPAPLAVPLYFSFPGWIVMGLVSLLFMLSDFPVEAKGNPGKGGSGLARRPSTEGSKGSSALTARREKSDDGTGLHHFKNFLEGKIERLEKYSQHPKRNFEWVTLWEASVENAFVASCGEKAGEDAAKQFKKHEEFSYLKYEENRALDDMIQKHIRYLRDALKGMTAKRLLENFDPDHLRKFEKE